MVEILLRYRRLIVIGIHIVLIGSTNYAAFELRFDGTIADNEFALWLRLLPLLVLIRGIVFIPFRLYEGLWRYTSVWDLRNIIGGVFASTFLFFWAIRLMGISEYPRSVFIIDAVLLLCAMGGVRLTRRIYKDLRHIEHTKRILVYGAGDAGEMVVRDMRNSPHYDYEAIGFIDDNPHKVGQRIHGVRVLGTRADLSRIMAVKQPHEVLIAISRTEPAIVRSIVQALEPFRVPIKTLPNLRHVIDGKVSISHIRDLSIEDLLTRTPIGLDLGAVSDLIHGKTVMVTGAGGSIGSELCRQIAAFGPRKLVLFERYENSLFTIANELAASNTVKCDALVGDITDANRVMAVMKTFRPQIVFHAAAHKHVPLMEQNPCEAVKNNIRGTRIVAEAASACEVDRFILISTDKAVKPTSIMGATKRFTEFMLLQMKSFRTKFLIVRFGNVLGSNGSVVPLFVEQIKSGGPVTVTDPEMKRFFMLIPEAVQLVLLAGAMGQGGTVHVLEMGEQVKIVDMARNLIRLSGFQPDAEIPICFIGLRPGEKLSEELVGDDELLEAASFENKILLVRPKFLPDPLLLQDRIHKLEFMAEEGNEPEIREIFRSFFNTSEFVQKPHAVAQAKFIGMNG